MTTFVDVLFPLEVSAWARGGRGFKTTVVQTYGGDEYRNAAWAQSLGEWDVAEALRSTNKSNAYAIAALRKFLMAGRGQLNGFRFRDPQDNQDDGTGILTLISGSTYQAYKRYTNGSLTYDQIIQKLNSDVTNSGAVGTWNLNTGVFTKVSGTAATWTGTFDIPARFGDDMPNIGLLDSGAYWAWQQLKIVEWKNWA